MPCLIEAFLCYFLHYVILNTSLPKQCFLYMNRLTNGVCMCVCVCLSRWMRKWYPKADWFHHLSLLCPVISLCNSDKCQTMSRGWALTNCSRHSPLTSPHTRTPPPDTLSPFPIQSCDSILELYAAFTFFREFISPARWRGNSYT